MGKEIANEGAPTSPLWRWMRILLLLAAGIEFLSGLGSLPLLAGDLSELAGPEAEGVIIIASIALRPIAAAVVLIALLRGYCVTALVAMALVILINWAAYLPLAKLNGLEFDGDWVNALSISVALALPPALAITVSGLALFTRRLNLAAFLAALPVLIGTAAGIALAIDTILYGV